MDEGHAKFSREIIQLVYPLSDTEMSLLKRLVYKMEFYFNSKSYRYRSVQENGK